MSKQYENKNEIDETLLWEVIKMEIGATSMLYAKRKKTRMKNEEDTPELEIKNLQSELEDCKTECDRNLG